MTTRPVLGTSLFLVAAFLISTRGFAQQPLKAVAVEGAPQGAPVVVGPDGKPMLGKPGGPPPGGAPGQPPPGQPGGPPGDAKPGEAPKDAGPKTNVRPVKPEVPPNPEELKVRPDANGRVRFNFQGQPWLEVLEWLARISDLSLDWQEMPGDFLNLRTQRSYTLDEARDLINRHLLDRGFSLLKHGEVLSVVNLKKLDPSLVPRVSPAALDECQDHEFVKVSFPLDSLTADAATEELKPMLSPNGKLTALKTTNRVEALDAAVNLREIRDMLASEQSQRGRKRLVREFRLEFTRAADVLEQLQELLGLDKKAAGPQPGGQNPQQMAMMQQQMMEMQQQRHGGQPGGPPPVQKQGPAVHMVVNPKENSIVAQAPADQMAIIIEAVKLIDVPSSRSQSLLKNMNRTQVYRLAAVDPEPLVKMLQDLGDLDPTTRLQIDKKNRSIIAYASLADHLTIRTLVTKLDGTDRKFEVIKLRRLEADYVAGTIEFMMGAGEKKKQNTRFNPFYWDFYSPRNNGNEEDESRKFRVDADVEHNRLLLWANAVELEEVNHLLVKLGEIPGEGGNLSTLRILDTVSPEDVPAMLERLKRTWPGVGPNPLEIAPGAEHDADDGERAPVQKKRPRARPRADETTTDAGRGKKLRDLAAVSPRLLRLVQAEEEALAEGEDADAPATKPQADAESEPLPDEEATEEGDEQAFPDPDVLIPRAPGIGGRGSNGRGSSGRGGKLPRDAAADSSPIHLGRGPDGKLVISSPDTLALDRMEDLLIEIAPPRKDYKVFKMKYKSTWAYGVALNLKDFFEEKDKNDQRRGRFGFWGYQQNEQEDNRRLSKRRPLKFIADSDSNSILVTGADPNQLKIIEELIDLYDVPESKDSASARMTKIVRLKYSRARVVADAIKDVYRDLLSANDPALQNNQNNQKQQQRSPEALYTYVYNSGSDDKKPETPAKFKGMLSLGVDELSNTLVVSAAEGLMETVVATVEALDEAARPTVSRMRVMKIDRNIDANELQKRLKNLLVKPAQPQQPHQPQQPQPNQAQQLPHPDSATFISN